MAKTLHLSLKQDEIPAGYTSLFTAMEPENKSANRLFVANRLWCQHDLKYRDAFLKTCSESFRSELGLVDFNDPESARREINSWVAKITQRKIENLLNKDSIKNDWRLVMTNAVYFKDAWERKFEILATRSDLFEAGNGPIRVQMMHQENSCRYLEVDGVQILEKSYSGGQFSMAIVLPARKDDALPKLEASLSEETLREWFSKLETKTVSVYLPRFRLDAEYDLGSTLQSLGMKKAFSRNDADLTGMLEQPGWKLWIDSVVQKAFIAVDEEGTEAAAASGMGMGGMGGYGLAPEIPIFRADHPFLFMIRDTRTGCILFMGRVMNPPVEKSVPEKQGGMGMF
jgi:serpin B